MMWRLWILLAACAFLAACATTPGPGAVEIPVAVKCAAPAPPRPALVDAGEALKAAPDLFAKVRLLLAGRAQRDAYIAELEASRAGCD